MGLRPLGPSSPLFAGPALGPSSLKKQSTARNFVYAVTQATYVCIWDQRATAKDGQETVFAYHGVP